MTHKATRQAVEEQVTLGVAVIYRRHFQAYAQGLIESGEQTYVDAGKVKW